MSSGITLTAGVRQNLLSLQNTADLMATTQNRLATGKKVNSALDNPTNFFTSSSLSARSSDLSNLLDAMSNGIKTLEAADNGITSIKGVVENMASLVRSARADKTTTVTPSTVDNIGNTSTATNNKISFDLGSGVSVSIDTFTSTNATVSTTTGSGVADWTTDLSASVMTVDDGSGAGAVTIGVQAGSITLADKIDDINADLAAGGSTVRAEASSGQLKFVNSSGETITVGGADAADFGFSAGNSNLTSTDGSPAVATAKTAAELISAINSNSLLSGKILASAGTTSGIKLQNLTTSGIAVTGMTGGGITGASTASQTLAAGTSSGAISDTRRSLMNQFNDLRTQLDRLAQDSSYNGINLLNGDKMTLQFNEYNTSYIDIQGKNADQTAFGTLTSVKLGVAEQTTTDFGSDSSLDSLSSTLQTALSTLRTQAAAYGSSLTMVQNRQSFTKAMMNTLQTGADNLVLADSNEEGANMLALQTRQQLSTTALSLANQSSQAVLKLF